MKRPHLAPGTREAQCPICGLYFTSPRAFALHKGGRGTLTYCLGPASMRKKGMVRDGKGRWTTGEGAGPQER